MDARFCGWVWCVVEAVAFGRLHEVGSSLPDKDVREVTSRLGVAMRAMHGFFNKRGFGGNGDIKVRLRPKPSKKLMVLSSAAILRGTLRVLERARRGMARRTWCGVPIRYGVRLKFFIWPRGRLGCEVVRSGLMALTVLACTGTRVLGGMLRGRKVRTCVRGIGLVRPIVSSKMELEVGRDSLPRTLRVVRDST